MGWPKPERVRLLSPSKVVLVKAGGRVFEDVDAQVSSNVILFNDPALPLEVGDIVQRKLPSGLIEEFEITEPTFCEGLHSIPAHYQAKYRPVMRVPKDESRERVVTYNLSGNNARVNIHSTDNSINVNATEVMATDAATLKFFSAASSLFGDAK